VSAEVDPPCATSDQVPDAAAVSDGFDPQRPYRLDPKVALRPEEFGALAYHYGTRRLAFLKSPVLVDVVKALADHPSADDALAVHVTTPKQHERFAAALAHLAGLGIICPR
jgi:putative mycofactocin binding protein MftB